MNEQHKKNIRTVAWHIARATLSTREENPIGFNMGWWKQSSFNGYDKTGHNCGTTACIAGWAREILTPALAKAGVHPKPIATDRFGLALWQADSLFYRGEEPTNCQAAATLYHLAETGKVDWEAPIKPYPYDEHGEPIKE